MVVIPYVAGLLEYVSRVMRKHCYETAHDHETTQDKSEIEKVGGLAYEIPCKSCDACYVVEIGGAV